MEPNHSPNSRNTETRNENRAFTKIAHGIYLQIFLGVGCLLVSRLSKSVSAVLEDPDVAGVLLIGLGLNSLIYIRRYKRETRVGNAGRPNA